MKLREWCDSLNMAEGDRRRLWKYICESRSSGAAAAVHSLKQALLIYYPNQAVIPMSSLLSSLNSLQEISLLTDRPLPADLRDANTAGVVPAAGGAAPTPENQPAGKASEPEVQP
jgi:hypothetical protein